MGRFGKFKGDNANYLLNDLFYETTRADKSSVVYTLKDEDHAGYPSLKRLYLETNDPTEYKFARNYLHNWEHWQRLTACNWFKEYLTSWRNELLTKLQSSILSKIQLIASSGSKEAFAANRYLLEALGKPTGAFKLKGRYPTSAQEEKLTQQALQVDIAEDAKRLLNS